MDFHDQTNTDAKYIKRDFAETRIRGQLWFTQSKQAVQYQYISYNFHAFPISV